MEGELSLPKVPLHHRQQGHVNTLGCIFVPCCNGSKGEHRGADCFFWRASQNNHTPFTLEGLVKKEQMGPVLFFVVVQKMFASQLGMKKLTPHKQTRVSLFDESFFSCRRSSRSLETSVSNLRNVKPTERTFAIERDIKIPCSFVLSLNYLSDGYLVSCIALPSQSHCFAILEVT